MRAKPRRRFPYLDAGDRRILDSLGLEEARQFEAFIRRQARSDRRYRQHQLPPNAGAVLSVRRANFSHGAGGGRRRPDLLAHD